MARKILVVDDDYNLVDILKIVLNESGYAADTCSDGQQAMDYLEKLKKSGQKPTEQLLMILLDLNMPVVDGWKVSSWLNADVDLRDIPLVVISATKEEGEHARSLHSDAYLVKPFTTDEFLGVVSLMELLNT